MESAQTRERVLGKLDFLVKQFVDSLSQGKRLGGKIYTFGSYRLGVHDRGADIDALCVVPRHISRRDAFTVMYYQARISHANMPTYVPLINLIFINIPIDLTFARLNVPVIKDNFNLLIKTVLIFYGSPSTITQRSSTPRCAP